MTKNYMVKDTEVNETKFNPQLQHFDYICGQVQKENRILRYVVVVSCVAFLLSIACNFYAVNRPASIPVLITMNDFGETHYVGEVSRKNYQNFNVPEIAMQYQVKKFINLYYEMSTDSIVMKKNMRAIYNILTSDTAGKYSRFVKEANLFEDFGDKTREVFFQTEPLQLSKDSYQIDFQVITRNLEGQINKNEKMRAVISVKVLTPSDEDIKENPLGIYITAFDIKSLNTANIK